MSETKPQSNDPTWIQVGDTEQLKIGLDTLCVYSDSSESHYGVFKRRTDDYLYFENCHTDNCMLFGKKWFQRSTQGGEMEPKKGDRFLVEVEIDYVRNFEPKIVLKQGWYMTSSSLEKAQKIEPEYEDGEWYWGQPDLKWERRPWFFLNGKFYQADTAGISYLPSQMHWIGEKIERPEE